MIVVTGAAGFIGSCLISKLNQEHFNDLILVDDFSKTEKSANFISKRFTAQIHRNDFFSWLNENHRFVEFIFHIGARTDTAEFNVEIFNTLNLNYSKTIWEKCVEFGLPLIYASSAATYGDGQKGYDDQHSLVESLIPLNPYGESKNDFDKWVLKQEKKPYFWAGFKFFNVYGPNEYHKKRMASVIFHSFHQIKSTGKMKLFRSHRPDFKDGEQKRDFVYVKDVISVLYYFMRLRKHSAIYNLGTGAARTFLDLTKNTFKAMNVSENIEFIDTPLDIRDKYQYFTEANIAKLREAGYFAPFYSLENGIEDYVKNYLLTGKYF